MNTTNERLPIRISTWPMWVLGFVVAIDQADQNVLRGVQTLIKADFHLSDGGVGLLASAFVLVNGLTTIPAGYLADRWNRKRAIGHTIIGWSAIASLTAVSQAYWQLLFVRGLLGFGQGVTEPSAGSLISDYYPTEQRGKAFSNQQVMTFVGIGVGLSVGGAVGDATGSWRWAFVAVGIPGALVSLLVYGLREPRRGHGDRLSLGIESTLDGDLEERPPLFEHGLRTFVGDMARGLREDLRTIWQIPTMKFSLIGVGALLFTVTAIGFWLPVFYERYHGQSLTRATASVGVVLGVGGIAGTLVGGVVADRFQNRVRGARLAIPAYCILLGTFIFTIGYFPMPVTADLLVQLIGIFVITIAIPALRAGLADAVPAHLRGAGFAAFSLVSTLSGAALAPPLLGLLSDLTNLRIAFFMCSPPVFVGAFVLLRARDHLDEDVAKIMFAVQRAYTDQEALEEERRARAHHELTATEIDEMLHEAAALGESESTVVAAALEEAEKHPPE